MHRLTLAGYELIEELGSGVAGIVYKARQLSTGQAVAVKILKPALDSNLSSAQWSARFDTETRLLAQLNHPHIVRLMDKGRSDDGSHFAVFEFVAGETLHQLLQREGALSPIQTGQLMRQVLDALNAAHAQGIAHRDLKPQNMMVTISGTQRYIKLLDFGLSTLTDLNSATTGSDTAIGLGSPRYSAPEQLRGEPPTLKSDLYAFGLLILECLSGQPAIKGQTTAELYHQHLSPDAIPIPDGLNDAALYECLRQALRKDPRLRPDTAQFQATFSTINWSKVTQIHAAETNDVAQQTTCVVDNLASERRQISVLSFALDTSLAPHSSDQDKLEQHLNPLFEQALSLCTQHQGFVANRIGYTGMVYFGYPQASTSGARQAARAALAMRQQLVNEGIKLKGVLHAGFMLCHPQQTPSGLVAQQALDQLNHTHFGTIAVSPAAQSLVSAEFVVTDADPHGNAELLGLRDAGLSQAARSLIGRTEQWAHLLNFWRKARSGQVAQLALIGEAGIGKSQLASRLQQSVSSEQHPSYWLVCHPEHAQTPLFPFLQWLQQQLRAAASQQSLSHSLSNLLQCTQQPTDEVLPIMCSWLGLPIPDHLPPPAHAPARQRQMVLETLVDLLVHLHPLPALIVLEDSHWLDPTSRELVALLSQQKHAHALLLTSRPVADLPDVPRLDLQGLSDDDAYHLVRQIADAASLDDASCRELIERAQGNPLFLTELTRARSAQQARSGISHQPLPSSVSEVLSQTLDRLGPAKQTAQLAAVLGPQFERSRLFALSWLEPAVVEQDLQQMQLADLIAAQSDEREQRFHFRHRLIRDAAYDSMPSHIRRQTHLNVAQHLEQDDPQRIDRLTLAQHFAAAERFERAFHYGNLATSAALNRAMHEEAFSQNHTLQHWIEQMEPSAQRQQAELQWNLLNTQILMSRHGWADPRVRHSAEAARQRIAGAADTTQRGSAIWALATYHHVAGDRLPVRELTQQLHEIARDHTDTSLTRGAYTFSGIAAWIDGEYPLAHQHLTQMLAQPPADGLEDAERFGLDCRCWGMAALANVHWFLYADEAEALRIAQQAVAAAERLNHIPSLGLTLMYQAFLYQHADDHAEIAEVLQKLLALSRRYSLPAIEAYAAILDCWQRQDHTLLTGILSQLNGMGCQLGITYLSSLAADLHAKRGDYAEALHTVERSLESAAQNGERYFEAELLLQQAEFLTRSKPHAKDIIQASLQRALHSARARGMRHSMLRAQQRLQVYAP